MNYVNGCSRINQQTLDLLEDKQILRIVKSAIRRGDSKRSLSRRLGLNWRQVDILVTYIQREEVIQ